MKKRHDLILVGDIIENAKLARAFVKGLTKTRFKKDLLRQAGICRQFEIVGEAANRLSPEFRAKSSSIPWKKIIGMRNILIHMYEEVDLDQLWKTVEKDLPKLISELKQLSPK
jgi:uncharacterized protein with HEPN domain